MNKKILKLLSIGFILGSISLATFFVINYFKNNQILGARTEGLWFLENYNVVSLTGNGDYDVLIPGTDKHLNFGSDYGNTGYGFRDNGGTMEYKNDGGSWAGIGSGGGGSYTAGGTLLNLTSTTFSVNEGTLTDTKLCTYVSGTGLVCNTDQVSSASDISIDEIGTATYDDLQDWINTTQSAGKLTGGDFTDNGDGSLTVAAGTGFIKTTDSDVATTKSFDWSQNASVSLTDNATNYIYVDYNAGSPQIAVSTSMPSDHNTKILLGMLYREGTDLHTISAGQVISNFAKRIFWKSIDVYGKFQRASGLILSETGTKNVAVTAGSVYAGFTKTSISAIDTSGSDTMTFYYRDGGTGWNTQTSQTQLAGTYYDDNSGTLATLDSGSGWRPDDYGVYWMYEDIDGDLFMVYGRGSYTLTEAQEADPPGDIPTLINDVGGLIAKVIIQKDASSFTDVQSAFDNYFSPTGVNDHNSLAGLQGGTADEYYHLTEAEHTVVGNTSGINTGDVTYSAGTNLSLSGTEFSVDDSFLLNTGDIGTGVFDFGGATSFEIVNSTAPTIDASGEIGVDTTADQIQYYGASSKRVLSPVKTKCIVVENLAADDDNMSFGAMAEAITVKSVWCNYAGDGTTVAQISLEDGAGNAMTHTTPTCTAQGTVATAQNITAGGSLTARELLAFDVDNAVDPETDTYTICISYELDAQ